MADFRVTVSDRNSGSAHQVEISGSQANKFTDKSIGDTVGGDAVGLPGYTLKITGGTDKDGFPMRSGLPGQRRRKILIAGGVGYKSPVKGMRRRKTMRGEEISTDIGQINTLIEEYGSKSIKVLLGGEPEEVVEETASEEATDESSEESEEKPE
ncbi:MAG: 30S ribosomal protein S6e [Methanosarcinales archaeon]|nr:30S ribosomal protein S6e [Methanosarcinales archaeon]